MTAAAWVLMLAASLAAQDEKKDEKAQERPGKATIVSAHALSWEEGGVTVTFLTGGVRVDRADTSLQAGRAMLWKRKDSTESFDEIYAEGNVIFTRGPQQLNCERFYFSTVTDQAAVIDVRLKGYSQDLKTDFFMMAKEARMKGKAGELVAEHVSLSSCSYGVPHYHLSMNRAALHAQELPGEKRGTFDPNGWRFDFDELVPEFSGIPFFYVPGLSVGPWLMNFPFRSISFGHTSRFGTMVFVDLGSRIRLTDEQGKLRQWGDIDVKVDWRQIRGIGTGLDFGYKWDGYSGYLDSYYLHDQGRSGLSAFDAQFPPLTNPDRAKIHFFHRHDLAEHWRYELEVNYVSDRSLLQEFFPREFKELKEPESAAYVRWIDGNLSASAFGRFRLNGYQTEDEYLPRLDFNLIGEPLLGGLFDSLYLTERVDVVNLRRRFDDALALADVSTWRADAVTELLLPLDFRYFQVSPFIQDRYTIFQNDLAGNTWNRNLLTVGTRVTTQIHATHPDVFWERVGLRGLRHVVELEARYTNTISANLDPAGLFLYEPVDGLARFEEVSFEIRQRLLTKDSSNKPFEFLTFALGIEYYPRPLRDTVSANAHNLTPPFNWIPVMAEPGTGTFAPRSWSNVNYDFSFHPHDFFAVMLSGEYNPLTQVEEVREVGITVTPFEVITGSVSHEYVRGVADAFGVGLRWVVTPKWSVSAFSQFDFRTGGYLRQEFVISRDFHDFAIEAGYERDMTRDENVILVALVPKFLGKAALRQSHLFRPGMRVEAPSDR